MSSLSEVDEMEMGGGRELHSWNENRGNTLKVGNICICVNRQEERGVSVMKLGPRLIIILKVEEDFIFKVKNFTLIKAIFKSY